MAISRLLPGLVKPLGTVIQNNTCLFEFDGRELADGDTELLIANVIYLILLFEGHGYLVSANSKSRECLSVQDGFIYFSSDEKSVAGMEALIQNFEASPLVLPKWVLRLLAPRAVTTGFRAKTAKTTDGNRDGVRYLVYCRRQHSDACPHATHPHQRSFRFRQEYRAQGAGRCRVLRCRQPAGHAVAAVGGRLA